MVQYRRNRLEGGTYFFTVTLLDRRAKWLTERVDDLRRAYLKTLQRNPFQTLAIVILPDHLHAIWALPSGDADYSGRWRLIKSEFSHLLAQSGCIRRRAIIPDSAPLHPGCYSASDQAPTKLGDTVVCFL
jgi:putative transposase